MKKTLTFLLLLISCYSLSHSQSDDKIFEKLLYENGNTNAGTEFFMTFHPCWETTGSDNYLKIYVISQYATTVTVKVEGKGYEQQQKTVPNSIIVFNLPPNIGQPYAKSDRELPEDDKVWKKYAIHVVADDPVICYGVTRFQYTSDAYLALPVHTYGKEYIISSWTDIGSNTNPGGQFLTSYTSAVAAYDATKVRYTGGGPSFSKTTTGIGVGDSKTFDMNRGDVLLMASIGSYSDLTGSKFTANKNIAAISGNFCSYVPEFTPACDFMIEQELPTYSWGSEYVVNPIAKREKNSWVKIFARQSGTFIYRDGELLGELTKGGGAREGECYLSMRVLDDSESPRPVVISSNKQISITQYNPGQNDDGVPSDPFQMVLQPIYKWSNAALFARPSHQGDGFQENYINIVYEGDEEGKIPNDFRIINYDSEGEGTWKQLNSIFPDSGEELQIQIRDKKYYFQILDMHSHGDLFKIMAETKFMLTSYGFSDYDSYGFPSYIKLNETSDFDLYPDTVAPICEPYVDCYGVVRDARRDGNSEIMVTDMPDDEDYRSNLATVIMLPSPISYNFNFEKEPFVPGEATETFWTAKVKNYTEKARLVVLYRDRAGNQKTDTLEFLPYKGKIVLVDEENPEGDFGSVQIGETKTLDYKIVNESDVNTIEIPYLKLISDDTGYWTWERYREEIRKKQIELPDKYKTDQGFKLTDMDGNPIQFNIVIPPMGEYPFKVSLTGITDGQYYDSLGLGESENCYFGYWLPVKATVGVPIIEVGDHDFGKITINKSSPSTDIYIKNQGTIDLIISDYSTEGFGTSEEKIFESNLLGKIDPETNKVMVIPPEGQIPFSVGFTPRAEKDYEARITFLSNAGTKTDNICILKGEEGEEEIFVPDIKFTGGKEFVTQTGTARITNTISKNLEIIDFIRPSNREKDENDEYKYNFKTNLSEYINIYSGKKVVLLPGEHFDFNVEFTPYSTHDYSDQIQFIFNSHVSDPFCKLTADNITVVEDKYSSDIKVYPNPTEDIVNIKCENDDLRIGTIKVLNSNGSTVFISGEINSTKHTLDLDMMPSGNYILRISTNKGTITKKIVVSK
jgi:hypothetical protein